MPNLKSVGLRTKELLRFHSGCHGMKISLVSNRNVVSAAKDLVPTSKKSLPFTNCIFVYSSVHSCSSLAWAGFLLSLALSGVVRAHLCGRHSEACGKKGRKEFGIFARRAMVDQAREGL